MSTNRHPVSASLAVCLQEAIRDWAEVHCGNRSLRDEFFRAVGVLTADAITALPDVSEQNAAIAFLNQSLATAIEHFNSTKYPHSLTPPSAAVN
jgi:hypothetical protein